MSTAWVRSRYCDSAGLNCVEVALSSASAAVGVRDSKRAGDPALTCTGPAWAAFLSHVSRLPASATDAPGRGRA